MTQDLKFALRSLAKNRSFAAAAILALALGIGANTAMFTVIRAVLLKPPAYRDPGRVVQITYSRRGLVRSESAARSAPSTPIFYGWFLGKGLA